MIELAKVSQIYPGGVAALRDIDLVIGKSEFVFLFGLNGAGKSTLLRLVYCEERPTSGTVSVLDTDLVRLPRSRVPFFRRHIGMIFQDFKLLAERTVLENVAFVLETIGTPPGAIEKRAKDALDAVALLRKMGAYPSELSSGERQRVSLARALAKDPYLLLADEPTGNVDEPGTKTFLDLLTAVNQQGTTVILATHDPTLVEDTRYRVVRLESGRLV